MKLTMFKLERGNIFTFLPVELGWGCWLVTELTLLLARLYFFGKGGGGGGGGGEGGPPAPPSLYNGPLITMVDHK